MKSEDLLDKIKQVSAVAYHKFVLLHKENSNDLFCFYEGNDSGYYYPRIKEHYRGKHHPISCGCKRAVIDTFQMIDKNYSRAKTSFFVDRDFDPPLDIKRIYETPCYSIENFYTTIQVVTDVLKNEFHLSENDDSYKQIISIFQINQDQYHEKSILFNAWYAVLKSHCETKGLKTNVNLNCSIPKEFVLIKIGSILGEYKLNELQAKYPDALLIDEVEVNKMILELKKNDLSQVLRGKFELEFMYEFFQYLIEDANTKSKRRILKGKTKFRIDKAQILSQLSQYALTPKCLINYIEQFN